MYKTLIDDQSVVDPNILSKYEVVGKYNEYWPGEDPEILHMSKLKISDEQVDEFTKILSEKGLSEGWFTLVWNEETVHVVLKDKVFILKNTNPWDEKELAEVIEYGEKHEVGSKYFLNMRNVMDTW